MLTFKIFILHPFIQILSPALLLHHGISLPFNRVFKKSSKGIHTHKPIRDTIDDMDHFFTSKRHMCKIVILF